MLNKELPACKRISISTAYTLVLVCLEAKKVIERLLKRESHNLSADIHEISTPSLLGKCAYSIHEPSPQEWYAFQKRENGQINDSNFSHGYMHEKFMKVMLFVLPVLLCYFEPCSAADV